MSQDNVNQDSVNKEGQTVNSDRCNILEPNATEEYDRMWYLRIEKNFWLSFPRGIKQEPEYFI